jgi:uncharacterized ferritin-like protein (DUF455 family)
MNFKPIDLSPGWTPSWSPFAVLPREERTKPPRAIDTKEGIGDRLRAAAFAELQAYYAFLWGAARFEDAPEMLKTNWRGLALAEERHLGWLLRRMDELGIEVTDRAVSDWLWVSLTNCQSAREFAVFMASAEERGRRAGVRFEEALRKIDPTSAAIFGKIAEEEVEHIRLAEKFFPKETQQRVLANATPYGA